METALLPVLLTALLLGYLLGSIPFGLVLTRIAGLGDVRHIGSGNIGATNVLRTGNKTLAAATLGLDMLKGTIAVLLGCVVAGHLFASSISTTQTAGIVAGLGAFLGHLYPVWLGFKGGKGVATYIGVLLGTAPLLALAFLLIWLAVAVLSRYSSLAALAASVSMPLLALFSQPASMVWTAFAMTILLVWKHRPNIERLFNGEEPKIGEKSE